MTKQAMAALARPSGRGPIELAQSLSAEEWATPSDCDGWRVQDVFAHMATVFHQVADPSATPADATGDAEATAELMLVPAAGPDAPRRSWPSTWSGARRRIVALGGLQEPPMADVVDPARQPRRATRSTCWPTPSSSTTTATCATTCSRRAGPIDRPALPQDEASLAATMDVDARGPAADVRGAAGTAGRPAGEPRVRGTRRRRRGCSLAEAGRLVVIEEGSSTRRPRPR